MDSHEQEELAATAVAAFGLSQVLLAQLLEMAPAEKKQILNDIQ